MNILIHSVPYMMNATYFIDIGYANALLSLGHGVCVIEYGAPLPLQGDFIPDISISYLHVAYSDKTDYRTLAQLKADHGTRIVVWGSPFDVPSLHYTDEHSGLHPQSHTALMKKGLVDLCITFYPPEGVEMYYSRWTNAFGIPVLSLPFAADTTVFRPCPPEEQYRSDLCFVGAIHRTKQKPFHEYIRPLLDHYTMIVSGRGWEGWPVRTLALHYGEESRLISSASLVPNVHMDLGREVPGMAPNMRAFQSVAGGACVVSDNVPALRHYFSEEEMPVGLTGDDYREKVGYFMNHPEERHRCWLRAYARVMREHTYFHRVQTLFEALGALKAVPVPADGRNVGGSHP